MFTCFFPAWLCPVCNKQALYTDLFVDQFFIDTISQCSSDIKAIEYDINGQWKGIGNEKSSRKNQQDKDGKSAGRMSRSDDSDDSDEEPIRTRKFLLSSFSDFKLKS